MAEDAAEALRELFRAVKREMVLLDIVAEAFDVEEHAFALFQDLAEEAVGVGAVVELRREFLLEVVAEVGAVRLGAGVEDERVQPLQRGLDGAFGAAGDDEAEPVGQAGGELEGEAADDAPGVAVVGLVPFDELRGDDGVGAGVGKLGGIGALAHAGVAGDPEEAAG